MKTTEEKKVEFLNSLNCSIDLAYFSNGGEFETVDELTEMIEDQGGFNVDITYYSNAIKYLKDNDPSLNESIEIAVEFGYELANVNSELLASLLASKNAREEYEELTDEIEQFLEQLTEDV